MGNDVKYAVEIVNKWEAPLQRFETAIDRINKKRIVVIDDGVKPRIDALNSTLRETSSRVKDIERGTGGATEKTAGWESALKKVGWIALAIKAIDLGENMTKGAILATAQLEKYNATLKVMLGSTGAARDRMQEYLDIAAKTPFELQQVVEAGNQLQAIGRYSRENLVNLGDLAAASGKPIEQVMAAFAKLSTGQKGEAVNMFRDLLISSEDWAKATGKGIKASGELMATTEEMLSALPNILKAKGFIGMMGEQSKTTLGQISNLKDGFFQLKSAMGDRLKPEFDSLIRAGSELVDVTKKWVEIPVTVKIAGEKAELNSLVGAITQANVGEETRRDLISDLQQQYPDFIGNLNAETISNEQLRDRLKQVNEQYDRKIKLAATQEIVSNVEKKYQETQQRLAEVNTGAQAYTEMNKLWPSVASAYNEVHQYKKGSYSYLDPNGLPQIDGQTYKKIESTIKHMMDPAPGYEKDYTKQVMLMSDFIANVDIVKENDSMTKTFDGEKKLLEQKLLSQRKVVDIYKGRLNDIEMQSMYGEAALLNLSQDKVYEKMFGSKDYQQSSTLASEFDKLRNKPAAEYGDADWQRLSAFMSGDLRYIPGGGGGGSGGNKLQKAEDDIAGGGRNMKVINITLDSLISTVNNVFEPGQDPAGASDFLDKLSRALTMVVNDVNYMP